MAALALSTLIRLTRELVGDLGIDSQAWTDTQITEALNFACDEMARKTAATYIEASPVGSAPSFTLPDDCIRVIRITASSVVLDKTDQEFEDLRNSAWRSATGTADRWCYIDGATVRVIPSTASNVKVCYIQRPTPMDVGTPAGEPDTRLYEYFHQHLKYAAAAYLLNTDGDTQDIQKADKMLAQFNSLIGAGPEKVAADDVEE